MTLLVTENLRQDQNFRNIPRRAYSADPRVVQYNIFSKVPLISFITCRHTTGNKCTVHCRVPYSNYDLTDRNWKYGTLQCLSESDTESIFTIRVCKSI